MKKTSLLFIAVWTAAALAAHLSAADPQVKVIDFLQRLGATVNGAGPMLVKADAPRHRIVLANNLTASVSFFTLPDHRLKNIKVASRPPHYLKSEALAIDAKSGRVYLVGDHHLHIVDPDGGSSQSIATLHQYEMVAIDERSGNAFLVGRETNRLALVNLKQGRVRYVAWCENEEKMTNLNATPPPPIRKVAYDAALQRIYALDGYTSTLATFSTSGKLLAKRALKLERGQRWHWAGYCQATHQMVLAVETAERKVVQAAKIDCAGGQDAIVALPGLTEGVGIAYHEKRDALFIAYDNHPSVHMVEFGSGSLSDIKVPTYGNDALAIDEVRDQLYVSDWAYGEISQVDLKSRRLCKRIENVGILPHMFSMAFHPDNGCLYIPRGGTAVNGSFGAALLVLEPDSGKTSQIYCGWAPVDLLPVPGQDRFLVFNSEDEAAWVSPDGEASFFKLPCNWPHQALATPSGQIYLSYGPHQSYWPVVYIWGAKNGILGIDPDGPRFYDRRIPRLAQRLALTEGGVLYALQNNWGGEKQFLAVLPDEVRAPNQGDMRLEFGDQVLRETTQRLLAFDEAKNWLYVGRLAEKDEEPGVLHVVAAADGKVVKRLETGRSPADLAFDDERIYVANFSSDTISVINKKDFSRIDLQAGRCPLKLAVSSGTLYWINHLDDTLQSWRTGGKVSTFRLPGPGHPDNIAAWGRRLVVTVHSASDMRILLFDPEDGKFRALHRWVYPYGDASFAGGNCAFYLPGQYGDALYEITRIRSDRAGRLWVSDFLSGKLFIVSGVE